MRIPTVIVLSLVLALPSLAEKKAIQPKSGAPFSPAILADSTLYVSGHIGKDPKTGKVPVSFEAEVRQCLDNIRAVLKEAGMGFEDVVAAQVYLTDMGLFERMNAVYTSVFKEPRPSRTTVGITGLAAPGARIEITVTARK